jgi:hypothetical protein
MELQGVLYARTVTTAVNIVAFVAVASAGLGSYSKRWSGRAYFLYVLSCVCLIVLLVGVWQRHNGIVTRIVAVQ